MCYFSPILQMRKLGNEQVKFFIENLTAKKRQSCHSNPDLSQFKCP